MAGAPARSACAPCRCGRPPPSFRVTPPVEQIEAYGVLGGIPAYLGQFTDRVPLLANIDRQILAVDSYLHLEPQFLLREELREPHNYFAILQAIAQGRTRLNEIAQATGIGRQPASRYLAVLQEFQAVERRVPVTERSRRRAAGASTACATRSSASDSDSSSPRRRCWSGGPQPPSSRRSRPTSPASWARYSKTSAGSGCWSRAARPPGPFSPRGWGRGRGRTRKLTSWPSATRACWEECKWTTRLVGTNVLDDLKRTAYPVLQAGGWRPVVYLLCARAGFTPALEAHARAEGVLLVGPAQLLAAPGV